MLIDNTLSFTLSDSHHRKTLSPFSNNRDNSSDKRNPLAELSE